MGGNVCWMLVAFSVLLGGCANLQTISRRTNLPQEAAGTGVAIHLDAQQRLVIYNSRGDYCAEPSPDAFAAYAAALGMGASIPTHGAASASQALQSSAASIGLRTQSITLMRDALYRLCEARANETLSDVSATMLMARSQDLTAVVVAVEQLTGAVAANQAILTGHSNASSSAQLVANQQLLDAARADEAEKEKRLADAKTSLDAQKSRVSTATSEAAAAQAGYDKALARNPPPTAEELAELKATVDIENQELNAEQMKLKDVENEVILSERLLAESKRVREVIQDNRDAALTQATASTGGEGQFSGTSPQRQLDKAATEAVAHAVAAMVTKVLEKDYTTDACSTLLTSFPEADLAEDGKAMLQQTRRSCLELIDARIQAQTKQVQMSSFGVDQSAQLLQRSLAADPTLRSRLTGWLMKNAPNTSVTGLIFAAQNAALRQRAIAELGIR